VSAEQTPQPGEMLQQGLHFDAADIWAAYEAGARKAFAILKRGLPVGVKFETLVARAADGYTKLVHVQRPRNST